MERRTTRRRILAGWRCGALLAVATWLLLARRRGGALRMDISRMDPMELERLHDDFKWANPDSTTDEGNTIVVKRHGKWVRVKSSSKAARQKPKNYGVDFGAAMQAAEAKRAERKRKRDEEAKQRRELRLKTQRIEDAKKGITKTDRSVWFYNDRFGERRRCELMEIPEKMKRGLITPNTYVFTKSSELLENGDALKDWVRVRELPGLERYIQQKLFDEDMAELGGIAGVPSHQIDEWAGGDDADADAADPSASASASASANATSSAGGGTHQEQRKELLERLGRVRNYFIRAYQSGVVAEGVDLHMFNRTLRQVDEYFPDVEYLPREMHGQHRRMMASLEALHNSSHATAQEIIALCTYLVNKGQGFADQNTTCGYLARIEESTELCNVQLKKTRIVFRNIAFNEVNLNFVDPTIRRRREKKEGDVDDAIDRDKARAREDAERDAAERVEIAKSGKYDSAFDRKAKIQAQRRKSLEDFLLRLPAMTLLQARRMLAAILGYTSRHFDRYPKDSLENYARAELDEKVSVEKMRKMLTDMGLPIAFVQSKSKMELGKLCMANGIDVEA